MLVSFLHADAEHKYIKASLNNSLNRTTKPMWSEINEQHVKYSVLAIKDHSGFIITALHMNEVGESDTYSLIIAF